MTKTLKIVLASLLGAALLVILAIAVYFSQPVQHWVVARLVDPHPEDTFSMEHARVGLTHTEIRGFVLQRPDIAYRADAVSADLSVWDIFFREHVNLSRIEASGLEIDFTRFWDVPRPEDPDPLAGLLGELDVPVKLTVGETDVGGRILLPGAGEAPLTITAHITGGGIALNEVGRFDIDLLVEDPAADGWLRELAARGEIALHQDEAGRFDWLDGSVQLRRFGQEPGFGEELRVEAALRREGDRETYRAVLSRTTTDAPAERLLALNASLGDADRVIDGTWSAQAESGQLAAFLFAERLPDYSGSGEGSFAFDTDTRALQMAGTIAAAIDELETVRGELRRVGRLTLQTAFDVYRDEGELGLEEWFLSVASADSGEVLLDARAESPIRYNRSTGTLEQPGEGQPLLHVRANGAPVELAGLLRVEDGEPPLLIDGKVNGAVRVSADSGGFLAESIEPVEVGPVTAISEGEVLLADAIFNWNGAVSWVAGEAGFVFEPFQLSIGGVDALRIEGRFSSIDKIVDGRIQADLAALLSRPAVGFDRLARGRLEAELEGSLDGLIETSFLFHDGMIDGAEEPIPPVYLDLRTEHHREGVWRIEAPLRVDRPGAPTEVVFSGEVGAGLAPRRFELIVTGQHLVLPDLLELGDAFRREEPVDEQEEPGGPDESPFWEGWQGTVEARFETVQLGAGYGLEEVSLHFETAPEAFRTSLEAGFLGSPLSAYGYLRFLEEVERPYDLEGELEAPQVDVGGLFHKLQPERPPTLEGHYSVIGNLAGDGETPGELIRRLQGEVSFLSEEGILRLFYTESPLVGLGLGVAGLLGGLGGELGTIIDIANELAEIRYDRAEALLERDEGLNLRLHGLEVIAPEMHLTGTGILDHQEGVEFLNQPMNLELELAARGELEELLGRAGVLSEERDELGYRRMMTSFSIEGTPADPDVTPFFAVIARAVLELSTPDPGRAEDERQRAMPPREEVFGSPDRDAERPE